MIKATQSKREGSQKDRSRRYEGLAGTRQRGGCSQVGYFASWITPLLLQHPDQHLTKTFGWPEDVWSPAARVCRAAAVALAEEVVAALRASCGEVSIGDELPLPPPEAEGLPPNIARPFAAKLCSVVLGRSQRCTELRWHVPGGA